MLHDRFRPTTSDQQLVAQEAARGRQDGAAMPTASFMPTELDRLVRYADEHLKAVSRGPGPAWGLAADVLHYMTGSPPNSPTREKVARFLSVDLTMLDQLTYGYLTGFVEGAADVCRKADDRR